jgi:hypothetical protein
MIFLAVMSHTNQAVSYPYKTGTMTADLWLNHRRKLWYPGRDNLLAHCFTVFIQFPGQLPSGGAIVIQIFIWFPWKTRFIITMITRNPWKPQCDLNNHSAKPTALYYFDTAISKTVCYNGCMDLSVQTHYPSCIFLCQNYVLTNRCLFVCLFYWIHRQINTFLSYRVYRHLCTCLWQWLLICHYRCQ